MRDIVRAEVDDCLALADLFANYREFYGQRRDVDLALRFLLERLRNAEAAIFFAVAGARLEGFVLLYPLFSSVRCKKLWLLNDLYVQPSARRSGVAKSLLERAEAFALETSAAGLTLRTARENVAAQRLYERARYTLDTTFLAYDLDVR
jgi:GNAT superfamily N-acetyltransferase